MPEKNVLVADIMDDPPEVNENVSDHENVASVAMRTFAIMKMLQVLL